MTIPFTTDRGAIDSVEFVSVPGGQNFAPPHESGISKYRADLGHDAFLDALFVNQGSQTLIVSLHGALPRSTTTLPRFERLRTLLNTSHNSLFFGDPTLYLNDRLSLAWYTGWQQINMYEILSQWTMAAADASGSKNIVFVGSSGGGFAALQLSAHIPGSLAVPMNPQTSIWRYQPSGSLGVVRSYLRHVMPHLIPEDGLESVTPDYDWSVPLQERASTLIRYSVPTENFIYYAQNVNDVSHTKNHFEPFSNVIRTGPNKDRMRIFTYDGPRTHASPDHLQFTQIMQDSLEWLTRLSNKASV